MPNETCVTSDPRVLADRRAKEHDWLKLLPVIAKQNERIIQLLEEAQKWRVDNANIEYRR